MQVRVGFASIILTWRCLGVTWRQRDRFVSIFLRWPLAYLRRSTVDGTSYRTFSVEAMTVFQVRLKTCGQVTEVDADARILGFGFEVEVEHVPTYRPEDEPLPVDTEVFKSRLPPRPFCPKCGCESLTGNVHEAECPLLDGEQL